MDIYILTFSAGLIVLCVALYFDFTSNRQKKKKNIKEDDSCNTYLDKYSSKIATIYLELHSFNFRHGTFQRLSENFIGRDAIRNRLRAILTHSDTNSGTYLITGQRGVGKTSLVNKVLDELSSDWSLPLGVKRYCFWFGVLFIFKMVYNILQLSRESHVLVWVFLTLFVLSLIYTNEYTLCRKKTNYFNLYGSNKFVNFFIRVAIYLTNASRELLALYRDKTWETRLMRIVKFAGLLCGIMALSILIEHLGSKNHAIPFFIYLSWGIMLFFAFSIRKINATLLYGDSIYCQEYKHQIKQHIKNQKDIKEKTPLIGSYYASLLISSIFFFSFILTINTVIWLYSPKTGLIIAFTIASIIFIFFYYGFNLKLKVLKCLLSIAYRILKIEIKKHYAIKNIFNSSKQIFIKINLGYEELKSIDVLRLVTHHITLEYRKYLFSKRFYLSRLLIIIGVFGLLTYFLMFFISFDPFEPFNMFGRIEWIDNIKKIFEYILKQVALAASVVKHIIVQTFTMNTFTQMEENTEISFKLNEVLYFFFLLFMYFLISRIPYFKNFFTPYNHLKSLEELQESIAATIKKEEGIESGIKINESVWNLGWNKHNKTEKNYPMSDAHDIEKKLIDILDNITESSNFFTHPKFIVIFDELDKIESAEQNNGNQTKTDSFSPDTIRNRQEAVFKLLSGLKYFLTTAQAKFIFVAGREIYEASLADAADRSHYMSSIFNDVINVPTFMSDFSDDKCSNICSMTEQFVCKLLFPKGYVVEEYSLEEYNRYLTKMEDVQIQNMRCKIKSKQKSLTTEENETMIENARFRLRMEREKTIILLRYFVIYLTHVGKGAPKKMISLFEKYVERRQPYALDEIINSAKNKSVSPIIKKRQSNSIYYLKFDFYDQYTITLVARLVSPIIYRFDNTNIHQHGDKLLVSSLFFLDHLYKFHHKAFSWRALESSPELIDINKTPELRDHIMDLLHFLSQNDLKQVGNGLYDFRFFKMTAYEISFLTRVSEQASAIFNFTLDESLAVKQYYQRQLTRAREQYKADGVLMENTIDELANLHFTLGELHLYDEDIEDAIIELDNALSVLSTLSPKDMTSEQIVVLVKIMLSLGIAYERKNFNDQAYTIYSETVRLLISSRNMDLRKLGLKTSPDKTKRMCVSSTFSYSEITRDEPEVYFQKKKNIPLMTLLDETPYLHPDIHTIISKITVYESLRLLYLPILAKFQMLEKSQLNGIQKRDISRLLKEFYFLSNMLDTDKRKLIAVDFYTKVADILYYKNSNLITNINYFANIFPFHNEEGDINHHEGKIDISNEILFNSDSYYFYGYAISILLNIKFKANDEFYNDILSSLIEIDKKEYTGWDDSKFNLLGKLFSSIGDMHILKDKREKYLCTFYRFIEAFRNYEELKSSAPSNYLEQGNEKYKTLYNLKNAYKVDQNALTTSSMLYILSALFYKKATAYNQYSYQYSKILTQIITYSPFRCNWITIDSDIANFYIKKSIKGICNSYKDIHLDNAIDIRGIFNMGNDIKKKILPCASLVYDEIFETILAYHKFRFEILQKDKKLNIEEFYSIFKDVPYEIVSNIYCRIKLLNFKSTVNAKWLADIIKNLSNDKEVKKGITREDDLYQILEYVNKPNIKAYQNMEEAKSDKIAYLVSDTIFNLREIIKFANIYGETYLLTNFFIGNIYHKLARWVSIKESVFKLLNEKEKKKFNKLFDKLVGELDCEFYRIHSHLANSQRFFYKAIEMHSEGRTYKNMINRACYVNDEYSDQRFHFITAREAVKISSSNFKNFIKDLSHSPITNETDSIYNPSCFIIDTNEYERNTTDNQK